MGCTASHASLQPLQTILDLKATKKLGDDFHSNLAKLKSEKHFFAEYDWERRVEIGSGITGAVYQVARTKTGAKYACKSLNLERIDRSQRSELWNEITILRELDHPNIVRLCGSYSGRTNVYLIMHMCTGGSLINRLPEGELRIREILRQLCSAIRYCHMKGICHRDLKLDNVLYEDKRPDSKVMLIDFGLSKRFGVDQVAHRPPSPRKGRAKPLTTEIGNPWYMAPETTSGAYTEACDMWSLGVLAYFLLSKQLPFDHEDGANEVSKLARSGVVQYPPSIWNQYGAESKRFVDALLQVDIRRRWDSTSILLHSWFKPEPGLNSEGVLEDIDEDGEEEEEDSNETSNSVNSEIQQLQVDISSIVSSLREFGEFSPLKRAAYLVVAHMLPTNKGPVGKLRACFIEFDKDQTGLLSLDEFESILESALKDGTEVNSSALFDRLDLDRSGSIRYLEFLAATVHSCCTITDEMLTDVFTHLDEDGSNYITTTNMRRLLGRAYSTDQVKAMIAEADVVGDGKVSLDEFFQLMKGSKQNASISVSQVSVV